jgi:SNF2 family DNA or RNA helicase
MLKGKVDAAMEKGQWTLSEDGTVLIILEDGTNYTPNSMEIFLCEFKAVSPVKNVYVDSPSSDIPMLSFSKFPVPVRLLLKSNNQNGSFSLDSSLVCQVKGTAIPLNQKTTHEYIISENKWFPFEQGALEEISLFLKETGITSFGKVTLKQYLAISKSKPPFLLDETNHLSARTPLVLINNEEIPHFIGTLFPYQLQGYNWLKMISEEDAGCILADEMGLGKTAQIIALLANEKFVRNKPSMVIAPVTLMENWRREVLKFAPELKTIIHQGQQRTGYYKNLLEYDVTITTYETIVRDLSMFQMIEWNIVILDEAQAIKNPSAQRTLAVKLLKTRVSIAVTGTPIENRLTDIWSIIDFAFPNYLGSLKEFESNYQGDTYSAGQIEPLISPLILRRRVSEVAKDLPERLDIPQILNVTEHEAQIYEKLRQDVINEYGKNSSLVALIKLRKLCCHPLLYDNNGDNPAKFSKYQRLLEIIEEIYYSKEKLIIFTTFSGMIDLMIRDLPKRFNVFCDFIDGRVEVSERQSKIDVFSNQTGSAFLILNPRAAGSGLNITAANHVIHYNLEWNPAVEDQASARSYRRGQTRPVTIHRLYLANTVEETINDRIEIKRQLSEAAIIGTDGQTDQQDILQALMKSPMERNK